VVTNFFLSLCRSVTNAAPDLIFVSLHLSKSREYIYLRLKKYVVCFVNRVGCACLEGRALFGREGPVWKGGPCLEGMALFGREGPVWKGGPCF